jgi:hypothetical protein
MTQRDPAFLWETEAMRDAPHRVAELQQEAETSVADSDHPGDPDRWVTLRDANRATGIPIETLRKWGRRSSVPSYLEPSPDGGSSIRMIDLDAVKQRAAELGRPTTSQEPEPAPTLEAEPAPTPDGSASPPGTMIVPIDAWNKMLNQLGNLHEAGQQLAQARERAAKAETEAAFLRERLAELRRESSTVEPPASSPEAEPTPPETTSPAAAPPPPEKVWQYLVRRVRDRSG